MSQIEIKDQVVLKNPDDYRSFAKDVAILAQTCGRIGAIKGLQGSRGLAFANGILILVIAATTIIGATVLSFMATADSCDPVDERAKAGDR